MDVDAVDADDVEDDEILEVPLAPIGSRVRVQRGLLNSFGVVRSISPGTTRMLIDTGDSEEGLWVSADDRWELADDDDPPEQHDEPIHQALAEDDDEENEEDDEVLLVAAEGEDADEEEASADGDAPIGKRGPILEMWRWTSDGAITGCVYNKPGFRPGETMTTSIVPPEGRFGTYVVTGSGSAYRLGQRAPDGGGMRRSSRAVGKDSLLDAFAESLHPVTGAPHLKFAVGGVSVGGVAAEKIMRASFSVLDDNLVYLRSQYQIARRVVLLKDDTPVAAAVVEVHPEKSVLEVPILAAARSQRIQGHGSILVATLKELGARLRLRMLVVSATQESLRFWLRQGLHTSSHCQGAMRAELRKMEQSTRRGFANSITMAMELPRASATAAHVAKVLRRLRRRLGQDERALTPADAPAELGYEDVNSVGNFFLECDGRRRPVAYAGFEKLAVNVNYNKLEAFPVSAKRGWGVRCQAPIMQGQVVVEVRGRVLNEAEYDGLADPSYVVSFDDKLLALKRAAVRTDLRARRWQHVAGSTPLAAHRWRHAAGGNATRLLPRCHECSCYPRHSHRSSHAHSRTPPPLTHAASADGSSSHADSRLLSPMPPLAYASLRPRVTT